jgi:hypothetical protein
VLLFELARPYLYAKLLNGQVALRKKRKLFPRLGSTSAVSQSGLLPVSSEYKYGSGIFT